MNETYCWIWLSKIEGITPKEKLELIEKYGLKNLCNLDKTQVFSIFKSKEKVEEFFKNKNIDIIKKQLEYMHLNNITVIPITSKKYPVMLKNVYDPPIVLYAKGNLECLNKLSFAIVGARSASEYGIKVAKNMSYGLSKCGLNIVSGLATGIDKYAHIGTLNAGGKTIAVIGTGLDIIYPKENSLLYKKILEKDGLILTEYAPETKLKPKNFPARNRIISGISVGVLVVEASLKSGSLITAEFALDQGKNVYAIPRKHNKSKFYWDKQFNKAGGKTNNKCRRHIGGL